MNQPVSVGRYGSLMSNARSPALNQVMYIVFPCRWTSGLCSSMTVLCGPKRPPLSQKSLYGASFGGRGGGKIDINRGFAGSLLSTKAAQFIGVLSHPHSLASELA